MPGTSIRSILIEAAQGLAGISDTPRLDAELLLLEVLGWERHDLICRESEPLSAPQRERFEELLSRRMNHEPVAYIRGFKEFWGMRFAVGPGVLIPRPATELLVEKAVAYALTLDGQVSIADLGTGSGAAAIAIVSELRNCRKDSSCLAIERSPEAMRYAQQNVDAHQLGDAIDLLLDDWMEILPRRFDIVVSNPPYIAQGDPTLGPGLAFEPDEALFSGADGLDAIRALLVAVPHMLKPVGKFFFEMGATQRDAIEEFVRQKGLPLQLQCHRDLAGLDRVFECECCS